MKTLTFIIPVQPKPSNKRHAALVGGHARVVQDQGVREHQGTIAALTAPHRPKDEDGRLLTLDGPVRMDICAVFPQRKSTKKGLRGMYQAHTTRPDRDNLAKSIQDGMSDWYADDCQVYAGDVSKWWGREGDPAHYRIRLTWDENEFADALPF